MSPREKLQPLTALAAVFLIRKRYLDQREEASEFKMKNLTLEEDVASRVTLRG